MHASTPCSSTMPVHERGVGDVADHQRNVGRKGFAVAGRQVIEHHHVPSIGAQGPYRVRSDVAGAAGDENGHGGAAYEVDIRTTSAGLYSAAMASKKAMLEHLRNVPLFSSCSTKELEKISKAGDIITLPAGSVIIDQGQTGREAFVIIDGEATVRRNGKKVTTVGSGAVLGELSLLDHGPRTATVVCDTDCEVHGHRSAPLQRRADATCRRCRRSCSPRWRAASATSIASTTADRSTAADRNRSSAFGRRACLAVGSRLP